jgi:two-component system response regulator NreC
MKKITLILADDHSILRAGLRSLLSAQPDMEVLAEAGTVAELVQAAEAHRPDVVLLDLSMPDGGGLRAIDAVRGKSAQTRFLVLTMHDDPLHVRSALASGVSGYVLKSAAISDLGVAIRAVHRGRLYLDVILQSSGGTNLLSLSLPTQVASGRGRAASLSKRERQVLKRLALGHTYRSISEELHLSQKSVETYRTRLADKLGIRSRAGLVRYALDIGLHEEPDL